MNELTLLSIAVTLFVIILVIWCAPCQEDNKK